MKKTTVFLITLFILFFHSTSIHAQSADQLIKLEGTRQQLILNLFKEKIRNAVTTYYRNDSLRIGVDWWNQNYQVVKVTQNNQNKYPYTITFTVLPHTAYNPKKTTEYLGTDTVTFGITSSIDIFKSSENISATILNYQHNAPPKTNPQIIRRM